MLVVVGPMRAPRMSVTRGLGAAWLKFFGTQKFSSNRSGPTQHGDPDHGGCSPPPAHVIRESSKHRCRDGGPYHVLGTGPKARRSRMASLAGCAWVAPRATFCRDLQSCDVQNLRVSRRIPFESLTLHHLKHQPLRAQFARVVAPGGILRRHP